jgi:Zn-dependent protease with chaperone function
MNEDKAARYQRLKRYIGVASFIWTVAILSGLLWSGASVRLRQSAEFAARGGTPGSATGSASSLLAIALYVIILVLITEMATVPLAFYGGFVLERRYGLSTQRVGGWLLDQLKSVAIGIVLGTAAAIAVYSLIRLSPLHWWLPAGVLFAMVMVGLTNLAPVLLLPLFYAVKPLGHDALRARLLALARRAGADVLGAYEWGMGSKTKKANAALAGLGATRRILVSDTMLADYTEDEIEVVLAHELAHHVHGDIWKGIGFDSLLVIAGCFAASRALAAFAPVFLLRGVDDVAGVPLLMLAAAAVSFVMVPVAHAMSRSFERRADRFALELTRNPGAFASAMRRLAMQNLAEERPSKLVEWLFYSHPPFRDRIAAADAWRKLVLGP